MRDFRNARRTAAMALLSLIVLTTTAQQRSFKWLMRQTSPEFFNHTEARQIGDQLLLYQRVTGGWPKNIDMARPLSDEEKAQIQADHQRRDDSTTDNDATTMQMIFLAHLYQHTGDERYRDGFRRAVEYLLSGQYENGGWPQFWPEMHGYQIHITYNDGAMVNTMQVLRDVMEQREPYQGTLTDEALRQRAEEAFNKGIDCILTTQIVNANGQLTVWCQQHDRETFAPAPARSYELPSYCSMESAGIVRLLMQLPHPDERVKHAVHAAMQWFDKYKLTGYRVHRERTETGENETMLVPDSHADPLWARFYDLERCEPFVCDRDGIPRRHLEQIGHERRNGYSWYGNNPVELYPLYEEWANKHDPEHKVAISLKTKGINENGTTDWLEPWP